MPSAIHNKRIKLEIPLGKTNSLKFTKTANSLTVKLAHLNSSLGKETACTNCLALHTL